ncbi:hypothetical protein [Clostridium sp. CTA-6]
MPEYVMPKEQYIKLQKFIEKLSEDGFFGDTKINKKTTNITTKNMVQNILRELKGER